MVPLESNIPYMDRDHIVVDKNNPKDRTNEIIEIGLLPNSSEIPQPIKNIHDYLANPGNYKVDTLDIQVSWDYRVDELRDGRIVILDIVKDALVEYDLQTKKSNIIAEFGHGPGELAFSRDLTTDGSFVYVARADQKISIYNCRVEPCLFDKSITLDREAFSVALVGVDSFAIQGPVTLRQAGPDPILDKLENFKVEAVQVISRDAKQGHTFGATYDTKGHWMLIKPFVSEGNIGYIEKLNLYILSFSRFPLLYIYDRGGNLLRVFRVENFIIGHQKYWANSGKLEVILNDYSTIVSKVISNDNYIFVEVATKTNSRVENYAFNWDIERDYYCIDVANNESYYLGHVLSSENISRIVPLTGGLLLEREGTFFYAHKR